jgi:hypothetical protein
MEFLQHLIQVYVKVHIVDIRRTFGSDKKTSHDLSPAGGKVIVAVTRNLLPAVVAGWGVGAEAHPRTDESTSGDGKAQGQGARAAVPEDHREKGSGLTRCR